LRKKSRFFYFLVSICLIVLCFFLFSSLIFSGEVPGTEPATSPAEVKEIEKSIEAGLETENEERESREEQEQKSPGSSAVTESNEVPAPDLPSRGHEVKQAWDNALLEKISFLQNPLPGALVSSRDSQLPGAPRPYRNGVHEGLDFYSGACGIDVNFGDPVFAAGPGVVYRIDHDYQEPSTGEREELLRICAENGDTPEDILDKLRGRQVWLVHSHDIITRYAHLSEVAEHLQEGDLVEPGDFIGAVGNSGTSEGAEGSTANHHLHFEIWIGDSYLGEGLSPQEIRELWTLVLEK
jgi:murein DD-endopeptidase MepM/ murein hydrolase activator NlpD